MNQLEKVIVSNALGALAKVQQYVGKPCYEFDGNDVRSAHSEVTALVQLAQDADSGISGEAKQALAKVGTDLAEAMKALAGALAAEENNAALAAIEFALNNAEGMAFLRCWNQGDFDDVRNEWPEAPEAVFIGADTLHNLAA